MVISVYSRYGTIVCLVPYTMCIVQLKPLSVALLALCFHSLGLVQLLLGTRPLFWFDALLMLTERCTLGEGLDPEKKPIEE